jgi:predicted PurR-regulated permease PerM
MLGIDRHAARVTWTVFLIALVLSLIYAAKRAILVFILAIFFAYMLAPMVEYLERFTPRRVSRKLSLATVYSALIAILILGGIGLGSRLSEEGTTLFTKLPGLLKSQNLATRPMPGWLEPYRERILEAVTTQVEAGAKEVLPLLQTAGGKLATAASGLLFLVLVPILSFFFLKDARDIRRHFIGFFYGDPNLPVVEEVLNDLHELLGKYIRALAILSGAAFVSYLIFMRITGVPYSVLLAAIAAPLEFIPVVGPLTASVIILLVAAFSGYPHLLWIFIFLGVYRIFQDYILSPYLMSEGVELHPLLVIFGVLAGEEIGGISGMIISVPLIATLRVVFVRSQKAKQGV